MGAIAPWNGSAGAGEIVPPAHRLDATIKVKGHDWVGADVYGKPKSQQVIGALHQAPGRVVAVIRVVNTGSEPTDLSVWGSSIRDSFYGGSSHWPDEETIAPGASVQFRYVAHRGSAGAGDTMPVDFTVRDDTGEVIYDGVRLLLKAVGRG